jgi:pimeloyl-ACP methyl ester carboxylesterase
MASTASETGYAPAGELQMYYEVHGSGGRPLVLLHGAYMTVESFGPLLEGLAADRQVIVPEMQGHGRTADVEGPITYEGMADDTAALIGYLGLEQPDVVGYSMGAGITLQLGMRHHGAARRLVAASASFSSAGIQPEAWAMFPSISPEMFAGTPMEDAYKQVAPDPDAFPALVGKLKALDTEEFAWSQDEIRAITSPMLLIAGDSDAVTVEHMAELYRLLGGGGMGDLSGLPASQLAILPGTTHFMPPGHGVIDRTDWLLSMIRAFLSGA